MELTDKNYYSREANNEFMSVSQYKDWRKCEARAFAKNCTFEYDNLEENNVIKNDKTALIMGNFVGTKWESEQAHNQFKADNKKDILVAPTADDLKRELTLLGVEFKKSAKKPELFNLCSENNINTMSMYKLKAEYKLGEWMYDRTFNDPMFNRSMTGEHEKIITFEMFGVKWKCRLDVINVEQKYITDLKTTKDFKESFGEVHGHSGYHPFYEIWSYPLQLAVYQKAGFIEYGITFDMFISAVTKEKIPDFEVLDFDNQEWEERFEFELDQVKENLPRIMNIKAGVEMPERCGVCDYCVATKVLTEPVLVIPSFINNEIEDY